MWNNIAIIIFLLSPIGEAECVSLCACWNNAQPAVSAEPRPLERVTAGIRARR